MTVSVASLQKLMSLGLTTEQMAGVIDVLAVELAPLETMRRKASERQERYRQRESNVTDDVEKERSPTPPKEKQPTNVGSPPIVPLSEPDGFAAFWQTYPKRDGNADRKGALKAFGPAVARAGGHEAIVRAASRYAAHCRDKGKIGTEFVKQARAWLNGDLWAEWLPQEPTRAALSRVMVREGSPAWDAWKATGRRFNAMDLKDEHGHVIGRGWYFESEFPQQEQAA